MFGYSYKDNLSKELILAIKENIEHRVQTASSNDWGGASVAEKPWWFFGLRTTAIIHIGKSISGQAMGVAEGLNTRIDFYVNRQGELYQMWFDGFDEHADRLGLSQCWLLRYTPSQLQIILDAVRR